jgi:uncharacterized protein YoxC
MRQHFFSLRVTDMWNSLPDSIVAAPRMNAFKNRLNEAMQEHRLSLEMPSTIQALQQVQQLSQSIRQLWKDRVHKAGSLVESSHEKYKNQQQAMGLFLQ